MRRLAGLAAAALLALFAGDARADAPMWVVRDEDSTIILFGSVHVLPPGDDWAPPALVEALNDADGPPTQGLREVFAEQRRELQALHSELEGGLLKDLEVFNRDGRALDLELVADPGPKS